MADEQNENTSPEQKEYTPAEQSALEQGWVPKEEFDGDEHKWVDAGEFLRRGELFSKIDSQNRKLKEMEKTFQAFKQHASKVEETAYARALADLKAQKKEALLSGDADAVLEVEDEIDALKTAQQVKKTEPVSNEPHPEFVAWTEQNGWYNTSGPMRAFADALGRDLAQEGKSPSEVLKAVAKQVREEFPTKFRNPNRDKASTVESEGKPSTTSKEKFTLTEEEDRIMRTLVRGGVLTKEQYIADIKKVKERS